MPKSERINTCPETGISLFGVNILKLIQRLWPRLDNEDPRYVEARRRRDLLLDEHTAREADARAEKTPPK